MTPYPGKIREQLDRDDRDKIRCDLCKALYPAPNSCVLKFWGGQEKRYLLCSRCTDLIEFTLRGSDGESTRA